MAENKKEIRQVAKAHQRTPSTMDKFMRVFLSEDAKDAWKIIREQKVEPFIKRTFLDFMEIVIFGSSSRDRGGYGARRYHTSYERYYDDDDRGYSSSRRVANSNRRHRFAYEDCEFDSLDEVVDAIEEITDYLREYKFVSVAKLNNAIGISGDWTDKNWGWNDARDFNWARRGRRYILDFAPPIPAND